MGLSPRPTDTVALLSASPAFFANPLARGGEEALASVSLAQTTQNQRPIPAEQQANAKTS